MVRRRAQLPKQHSAASWLRRQIVSGRLAPGSRVPTRRELYGEIQCSPLVLQQAINLLRRDGFLIPRGRHGTFVAPYPPHLRYVALVLPKVQPVSKFYSAIEKAAMQRQTDARQFKRYLWSPMLNQPDDYEKLCDDALHNRFGAVIFASPPSELGPARDLVDPEIPRVYIGQRSESGLAGVMVDEVAFRRRAVEYLVSRGRKRIGHIFAEGPRHDEAAIEAQFRSLGIETRPYWMHFVPMPGDRNAAGVAHLLTRLKDDDAIDALIVHDDNLVPAVLRGLVAASADVPGRIEVLAHANFPDVEPTPLPLVRLGFDCRQIVDACLDVIERFRSLDAPALSPIQPVFQTEVV
jgi:DNA-binding LacI/PurR family transcriptional regulator